MKFACIRNRATWILALGFGLILAIPLVWWGLRQRNSDEQLYRIGFDNQPPQHYLGKDGKPTGLVIELIEEAAKRHGIRLQWSQEPEGSEAALKTKRVDLWPIMTIRPERKSVVYITDPYREDTICLLVHRGSAFTHLQDLGNSRIAFDGQPLDVRLLHQHVPNAKLSVIESPKERVEAVCQQRLDAAYFDEYTAITTLLNGVSCGQQGLRMIDAPELSGQLGVGATFEAKPAADAIRAEIGRMAVDGTVDRIAAHWGSLFSRNLEIATQLARAQTLERWLIGGISGVVLLLLYTLWQAGRIRRALKRAREATVLKNQFLANMSHEIRTPMNAIIGMTALATDTTDREEQAEYLNDVMRAGESLLALLNDILDFSKIEAGKLTFECVKFDPADVIREVCVLFTEGARTKGLTLTCQTPARLPSQVLGDSARLRQTLINLVGNAIKFTEMGRVDLEATIDSESDRLIRIRFAVKDTGIGISKKAQQRIFESFVQADGSVTRKYGGTGLGLSISTELISRMGGELRVGSAPGRGSTFWFILPFERVRETVVAEPPQGHESLEKSTVQ